MKGEILINIFTLHHNFLKKSFLRPLMPIYNPDIIGSYEEIMKYHNFLYPYSSRQSSPPSYSFACLHRDVTTNKTPPSVTVQNLRYITCYGTSLVY